MGSFVFACQKQTQHVLNVETVFRIKKRDVTVQTILVIRENLGHIADLR